MTTTEQPQFCALVVLSLLLASSVATAQDNKTVIGPSNLNLHNGAEALLAGDAEEGARLTLLGMRSASGARERHTGWSNLCAAYAMLDQPETALDYCNLVLEQNDRHWRAYNNRALVYVKLKRYDEAEKDLQEGEALAPNSRTLKAVRAMLRDAVEPVAPNIVIDDRRQPQAGDDDY